MMNHYHLISQSWIMYRLGPSSPTETHCTVLCHTKSTSQKASLQATIKHSQELLKELVCLFPPKRKKKDSWLLLSFRMGGRGISPSGTAILSIFVHMMWESRTRILDREERSSILKEIRTQVILSLSGFSLFKITVPRQSKLRKNLGIRLN